MALWNCACGRRAIGFAASAAMLFSMAQAMYGHVDIVNAFRSATQFTCRDDKMSRPAYTATTGEIYNFAFNTELHQYWDCRVSNTARRLSETRRFWGDDTHGGPQLWSCYNCFWSVQEVGVYFSHDGVWRYWYGWY